jgi:Amino acid permease
MFFLYEPLTAAVNLAYLGFLVQTTLRFETHLSCPWHVVYVIFGLLISLLIYRGIEISAAFVVWLTIVEVVVMIALAIAGLMHPGDGRVHLQDFVSVHAFGKKGFYLAIVFSIFTYTGFEAIAPLAEETRKPAAISPPRRAVFDYADGFFLCVYHAGHTDRLGHEPCRYIRRLSREPGHLAGQASVGSGLDIRDGGGDQFHPWRGDRRHQCRGPRLLCHG